MCVHLLSFFCLHESMSLFFFWTMIWIEGIGWEALVITLQINLAQSSLLRSDMCAFITSFFLLYALQWKPWWRFFLFWDKETGGRDRIRCSGDNSADKSHSIKSYASSICTLYNVRLSAFFLFSTPWKTLWRLSYLFWTMKRLEGIGWEALVITLQINLTQSSVLRPICTMCVFSFL